MHPEQIGVYVGGDTEVAAAWAEIGKLGAVEASEGALGWCGEGEGAGAAQAAQETA